MNNSLQFETNKALWESSQSLIKGLRHYGLKLASAESCTGGLFGALITEHPGASDVYLGGIIAYDNQIKHKKLGVPIETINQFGAVSPEVAILMARGGRVAMGADLVISVTGIAGPGGGSEQKPVGMVCFGLSASINDQEFDAEKTIIFPNNGRQSIRIGSVIAILNLANEFLNRLD